MEGKLDIAEEASLVLCGAAGQGLKTVENLLTRVLKSSGYNIFATKEFMSRIRGGMNSTSIRVSSTPVRGYCDRIDLLVPLTKGGIKHVKTRMSEATLVMGEEEVIFPEIQGERGLVIPLTEIAEDVGGKIYANTVAASSISALFDVKFEVLSNILKDEFSEKGKDIVNKNLAAAEKGFEAGSDLVEEGKVSIKIEKGKGIEDQMLLNGTQAVSLGSLAGGCNFVSFYPMTPGTGVPTFIAQHSQDLGLLVEQAEDEISAINMSIGAWYAGARGMVSTSGGGFALMVEGLSLSGILETPVVIHLAQRPGPGTGLPTRTEQGDLLFSVYTAHGEFPRVIYTPGSVEEAFELSYRAFQVADRYQVPVIILTDQYLVDSYYNLPDLELDDKEPESHYLETGEDYRRYELTEDGVSPRGVPGVGRGLVVADSDEHDEEGHITENFDTRVSMVDKRLKKLEMLQGEAVPPRLIGGEDYELLVIGWGSTLGILREAVEGLEDQPVSLLHFPQVYPVPVQATEIIEGAERSVVIENNATAQFSKLLRLETGLEIEESIKKYNGLPFSVEEVKDRLEGLT